MAICVNLRDLRATLRWCDGSAPLCWKELVRWNLWWIHLRWSALSAV